jgi:putative transcriptional regulator
MNFENWIRQLRIDRKLSMRALAKLSGVSIGTISRIETGKAQPTLYSVIRLCQSLDVQVTELFQAISGEQPDTRLKINASEEMRMSQLNIEDVLTFVAFFAQNPKKGREILFDWFEQIVQQQSALNQYSEIDMKAQMLEFDRKDISKFVQELPNTKHNLPYPSDKLSRMIEDIYYSGGILTLKDVGIYINHIRSQRKLTFLQLEKMTDISDSVLSRMEAGILTEVKLFEVYKTAQAIQENIIFGMYWRAAQLQIQAIERRTVRGHPEIPAENWTEGDFNVADVLIVTSRWLQYLYGNDKTWLDDLRREMADEAG